MDNSQYPAQWAQMPPAPSYPQLGSVMDHQTLPSSPPLYSGYHLEVRQEPERGKVALGKEKDKKPIDPPPIVELVVPTEQDRNRLFLQNPYLILIAFLEQVDNAPSTKPLGKTTPKDSGDRDANRDEESKTIGAYMAGSTVSSLHRLKDTDNRDSGFFIFPDLTVKKEGWYRIRFTLMTMEENRNENRIDTAGFDGSWITICNIHSKPFQVHTARTFPGMAEGVRIRLRKDSRQVTVKKRNHDVARHLKSDVQEEVPYDSLLGDAGSAKRQRTSSTGYSNPSPSPISGGTSYANFPRLSTRLRHHIHSRTEA
ncbi:VosA [Apiospora hydei]|uniref:VosA n=1 Tax=Apiospora hydei TaxID=1337664 RepID=A0ABR1WPC7_9PEZI